ncbi:MAG: Tic22 family protein [Xenococcaceae cyanobacterium]
MIRFLIHSTLLIGLVGISFLGPVAFPDKQFSWLPTAQVQALPMEEIEEKLESIPVFILTDASGQEAITVLVNDGDTKRELGVFFFSPQAAQAVLRELQSQDPEKSQNAQIRTITLDKAYEIVLSIEEENKDNIAISFQPEADEIQAAIQLLNSRGQDVKQFNGVPLFYATEGPNDSLITIEILDDQEQGVEDVVIPLFFSKEDLEDLLKDMGQQNPELASTAKIQVSTLENIVELMEKSNEPEIKQVVFIPSTAALQFMREQ